MKPLFPPSLVAAEAVLGDLYIDKAAGPGITRADAERLFMTDPASVRPATAPGIMGTWFSCAHPMSAAFNPGETRNFAPVSHAACACSRLSTIRASTRI